MGITGDDSLSYLLLLTRGEVVLDVECLADLLGSLTWNEGKLAEVLLIFFNANIVPKRV